MPKDLIAKLAMSKEEIAHLYRGVFCQSRSRGKTQMPRWR